MGAAGRRYLGSFGFLATFTTAATRMSTAGWLGTAPPVLLLQVVATSPRDGSPIRNKIGPSPRGRLPSFRDFLRMQSFTAPLSRSSGKSEMRSPHRWPRQRPGRLWLIFPLARPERRRRSLAAGILGNAVHGGGKSYGGSRAGQPPKAHRGRVTARAADV